ncbi:MAG TPA: RdgB/HAM1 family non-canonical purine NTP pyrophosphatase [Fimbriimonadaceae bacterium]|mgnify:CR=1 FL=1|nr:RdgB/HAM1 family non-canonical purine NTP pyrophosphatase [Fimbriimonadaceae bacterium]
MLAVIATHNLKKGGEMLIILSRRLPRIQFRTLQDYPSAPEPEESGATYAENAVIKAESAYRATGELSIADDAGLEVDALGGAPGLYSKRFAGLDVPFDQKMAIILEELSEVPAGQRSARFRCCVAVAHHKGTEVFEATCEGRIAREPSGGGGFGYDPIFFIPELGCTMADLTAEQKHAVSHRGKVLAMVCDWLEAEFGPKDPI